MSGREEREIVTRLNVNGWILFVALTVASIAYFPLDVTLGVVAGGLLVTVNLSLLHRFVAKALSMGSKITPRDVLPKYYLTFIGTIAIIYVLISQHLVHGLGLLLGLSIFLVNLYLVAGRLAGRMVYRAIKREAV